MQSVLQLVFVLTVFVVSAMRIDGLPSNHGKLKLMKRSATRNNDLNLVRDHEEYHGGVYANWEREADEIPLHEYMRNINIEYEELDPAPEVLIQQDRHALFNHAGFLLPEGDQVENRVARAGGQGAFEELNFIFDVSDDEEATLPELTHPDAIAFKTQYEHNVEHIRQILAHVANPALLSGRTRVQAKTFARNAMNAYRNLRAWYFAQPQE